MNRAAVGLLLAASLAQAAITLDNANSTSTTGSGSSLILANFTVGGGATALVVTISGYLGATSVTSITWNGSQTFSKQIREYDGSHQAAVEIWALVSPAAGTGNVAVTLTGTTAGGGWGFSTYSLKGTALADAFYGTAGTVEACCAFSSISDHIILTNTADWCIDGLVTPGVTVTAASGQTPVLNLVAGNAWAGSSYNSAGTETAMTWNWTGGMGSAAAHALLAVKAAAGDAKPGGYSVIM